MSPFSDTEFELNGSTGSSASSSSSDSCSQSSTLATSDDLGKYNMYRIADRIINSNMDDGKAKITIQLYSDEIKKLQSPEGLHLSSEDLHERESSIVHKFLEDVDDICREANELIDALVYSTDKYKGLYDKQSAKMSKLKSKLRRKSHRIKRYKDKIKAKDQTIDLLREDLTQQLRSQVSDLQLQAKNQFNFATAPLPPIPPHAPAPALTSDSESPPLPSYTWHQDILKKYQE